LASFQHVCLRGSILYAIIHSNSPAPSLTAHHVLRIVEQWHFWADWHGVQGHKLSTFHQFYTARTSHMWKLYKVKCGLILTGMTFLSQLGNGTLRFITIYRMKSEKTVCLALY
jgi:hypothetical protein